MWKLVPVLVSFLFALILVPASLPLLLPTPIMLLVPVLLPSLDAWPLVSASLVLLAAVALLLVWALSALVLASLVLVVPASLVVLLAAVVLLLVPAPAAVGVAWSYGSPMRPSGRAVACRQSASGLRTDCDQNLGEDLVDEFQIRPPNANHLPARPLKVSLATLLGLARIVYLADGLPVLDAAIWPRCGMRTISVRPSRGLPPKPGRGPRQ